MFEPCGGQLGLEWEPCHQRVALIDPLPQLRKWVGKCSRARQVWHHQVGCHREHGVCGSQPFGITEAWFRGLQLDRCHQRPSHGNSPARLTMKAADRSF